MTDLKTLDSLHGALAHEFNRRAHNDWGWLVKGTGVEHLFWKRPGVLEAITRYFTPETLFLRSLPDYCLRGNNRFCLIEIKGPSFISPTHSGRQRVRIEAAQACLLHHLYRLMGTETVYVFMNGDGSGLVCPVAELPIEELCETQRFREEWPPLLRKNVRGMFQTLYPNLSICNVSDPPKGSGDPFLAFDYASLGSTARTIESWFYIQGRQNFSEREHVSWEGQDSHKNWRSFLPTSAQYDQPIEREAR